MPAINQLNNATIIHELLLLSARMLNLLEL